MRIICVTANKCEHNSRVREIFEKKEKSSAKKVSPAYLTAAGSWEQSGRIAIKEFIDIGPADGELLVADEDSRSFYCLDFAER